MIFRFVFLSIFFYAAILFASCTRAQPTIEFWTMRTVWNRSGETQFPSVIFFVTANDPDGPDDLEELRLYHDEEGLLWRWTQEQWTQFEEAGRIWIGNKQLRMPQGEVFPSGQYKAVVSDKAGEQGERTFSFDPPKDSRYKFPTITVTEGVWTVVSDYPDNYFICYHSDGIYRNIVKLDKKTGTVIDLRLAADVFSIALWADDPNEQVSALSDIVPIRQ